MAANKKIDITFQFDVVMRQLTYGGDADVGTVRIELFNRLLFTNPPRLGKMLGSISSDSIPYPGLGNLMKMLRRVYKVNEKLSAFLYYEDSEGDLVRLSSEREWREVVKGALKVVVVQKGGNAVMKLLFSPKHHYKANQHGKVDFSKYDFSAAVMQIDESQMLPGAAQNTASEASTSETNSEPERAESKAEDAKHVCSSSTEKEGETKVIESKTDGQFVAEDGNKSLVCSSLTAASEQRSASKLSERNELIAFVQSQIPDLVDQFFKQKASAPVTVAESPFVLDVGESQKTVSNNSSTEITRSAASDATEKLIDEFEVENKQPCSSDGQEKDPNGQDSVSCIVDVATKKAEFKDRKETDKLISHEKVEHYVKFLFHDNVSGELVAIRNSNVHKVWYINNVGYSLWPKDAYVHLVNAQSGFEVLKSEVAALTSGDVGAASVVLKAPEQPGLYSLSFALRAQSPNEVFVEDERLGCVVRVVENPVEFSQSCMQASYCASLKTECEDQTKAETVEENETMSGKDEDEDEEVSTCEDETIYEDGDLSDDDSLEMIEDFAVIPLPDCFDLNRVPALQSSLIVQNSVVHADEIKFDCTFSVESSQDEFNTMCADESDKEEDVEETAMCHPSEEQLLVENGEEAGKGNSSGCEGDKDTEHPSDELRHVTASEEVQMLHRLSQMGFADRKKNKSLLLRFNYNLQMVVSELMNDFEPLR